MLMDHPFFPIPFDQAITALESHRHPDGYNPGIAGVLSRIEHFGEGYTLHNSFISSWTPEEWQGCIVPCLSEIARGEIDTERNYEMLFAALVQSQKIPAGSPYRDFADVTAVLLKNQILVTQGVI